jgi:hypothetical protein
VPRFLGVSVGLIQADMDPAARRAAYASDVTYVTNSELGFDYLRDNLAGVRGGVVGGGGLGGWGRAAAPWPPLVGGVLIVRTDCAGPARRALHGGWRLAGGTSTSALSTRRRRHLNICVVDAAPAATKGRTASCR